MTSQGQLYFRHLKGSWGNVNLMRSSLILVKAVVQAARGHGHKVPEHLM